MISKPSAVLLAAFAVVVILPVMPVGAVAADVGKEVKTASTHAGYAGDADSLKMVHTHLHHTVNCLVGPNGDGFDAKAMNPCKSMGKGAIPDATDADTKKALQQALEVAKKGLASDDLKQAQKDAHQVNGMLGKIASGAQ